MKLITKEFSSKTVPKEFHIELEQMFIQPSTLYTAYTMVASKDYLSFVIIDELGYASAIPVWFFEDKTISIPSNWICAIHTLGSDTFVLYGLDFLVSSLRDYEGLILNDRDIVAKLKQYIVDQTFHLGVFRLDRFPGWEVRSKKGSAQEYIFGVYRNGQKIFEEESENPENKLKEIWSIIFDISKADE